MQKTWHKMVGIMAISLLGSLGIGVWAVPILKAPDCGYGNNFKGGKKYVEV